MRDKRTLLFGLVDDTLLRFLLVGVINTLVGYGVMFGLWNLLGLHRLGDTGYWISSAMNYLVGSVVSYFLNKYFTFRNHEKGLRVVARFTLNILVCYALAYVAVKPLLFSLLSKTVLNAQWQGNAAMLLSSVLFVACNYAGQRFFAFRRRDDGEK